MTDQITLEIIQNSLQAAADEMFAAMRKTAMSSIIYEVLDMGTGITDGSGRLASSGAGIPAFVGVLDKSVQFILDKHGNKDSDDDNEEKQNYEDKPGTGAIEPGDVFITNDPWPPMLAVWRRDHYPVRPLRYFRRGYVYQQLN